MKRAIRGHDVNAKGLKNIAERAKEFGFEYIQLALDLSKEEFSLGKFSEEYANEIKNDLGDRKLSILSSYINPSDRNPESLAVSLEKFKDKIHYASILKPLAVGTETGVYRDADGNSLNHTEEAYQYVLKNIKELVCEAEKYDVNVAVEGVHVFVINSPERLARLVKDINSPNMKVIFDPVNYITADNYKEQDKMITQMFELLSDKIVSIHAKDFVIEDGAVKMVLPGEGMLNYKLIFDLLKKNNMDIPIISESIMDENAKIGLDNLEKIAEDK